MRNSTGPWLVVIAAITILCAYMIWPDNPGLFGREIKERLGLDIQGGLRVLMAAEEGADVDAEKMDEVRRVIDRRVDALGVVEPVVQVAGSNRIIVELPGIRDPQTAIEIIQQTALLEFVDFAAIGGCTAPMPVAGQYVLTDRQIQLRAAPQETPTPTGTTAPEGTPQPVTPTTTPTLEPTNAVFRIIQETPEPTPTEPTEPTPEPTAEPTGEATPETTPEVVPEVTPEATPDAAPGTKNNPLVNPCTGQPFNTVMTGAALRTADARIGGQAQNQYVVNFTLDTGNAEARNFARHTAANIGQPLAIVLDGEVLSAPTIQAALEDGGEIVGNFTLESARTLALQLRSGALPVSLRIESLEQVGASLGQESVEASIRAGVLGVLAVFIFLLVYYRVGGLAAALALTLFTMMNFALYKFIPVTLTLSAITGFLISIGSAIDGNILIFERVKEELRAGRNLNKAIELGFSRAWTSIRDSNISTIMIGLILYFFGGQFGASAVRGFAVTLILGLILNLFTAVVVTRVFLTLILTAGGERMRHWKLFGQ